jgi:phosphoribosylglycinamide formyltransferase-1
VSLRAAFCVSGYGSLFRAAVRERDRTGVDPALLVLETKSAPDLDDFAAANGIVSVRLDPRDRAAFDAALTELLPAFAGTRGIERTIESGVRIGGATIHEVIDAVDAGPIIAQAAVGVRAGDTPRSYGARLYEQLEPMFLQVLRWYADGRAERDAAGRIVIRDARYDAPPVVPALEHFP